jgi:hypothetical protein
VAQPTVFEQVVNLVPRSQFELLVHRYQGNKGVRTHDCWTWFGALLFGQLSGHDSIRALERVFAQGDSRIHRLGFGSVRRSTLADANRTRPLEILEGVLEHSLAMAKRHAPSCGRFRFSGNVFALDSSSIELCLGLSPWAIYHQGKNFKDASVKLHTAIDLAGDLPQFAVIAPGRIQDIRIARQLTGFKRGDTVVFDKGYLDFRWFKQLHDTGIFFVTRLKDNSLFKVVQSRATDRTRGLICDQVIRLSGRSGRACKINLRRIAYRDPDTGKKHMFLTNRFDVATQTICDLYRARWKVELFFKTLKQNLRIKKFLGTSLHAVKAQILVALIAYVLLQVLKWIFDVRISMTDTMATIGTLLLLREPLKRLLGSLPRTSRYPCSSQLVLNL